MKRLHVHVTVGDLERSIRFYSDLFAAEPTVVKPDYAKWMLEDPRVNFAISNRRAAAGLDHLGLQVDSREELKEIGDRLTAAGRDVYDRGEAHCCYAHSEKGWVADPQGIKWETFFTLGQETVYGDDSVSVAEGESESACCADAGCGEVGATSGKQQSADKACCAA